MSDKLKDLIFSGQEENQKLAIQLAKSQGICIADILVEYCVNDFDDDRVLSLMETAMADARFCISEILFIFNFLSINLQVWHYGNSIIYLILTLDGSKKKYDCKIKIASTAFIETKKQMEITVQLIRTKLEDFIKNRLLDTVMGL